MMKHPTFLLGRMSVLTIMLVTSLSALTIVHPATAAIVISEIMYDPAGDDIGTGTPPSFNREWVEIYNTGRATVSLTDWQIGDPLTNTWSAGFPGRTVIDPGQALVLTGNESSFQSQWGTSIATAQITGISPNCPTIHRRRAAPWQFATPTVSFKTLSITTPPHLGSQPSPKAGAMVIFLRPAALNTSANDNGAQLVSVLMGCLPSGLQRPFGGQSGLARLRLHHNRRAVHSFCRRRLVDGDVP